MQNSQENRKKRLWHRCFQVNFPKFLRIAFLKYTSGRLILYDGWNYFRNKIHQRCLTGSWIHFWNVQKPLIWSVKQFLCTSHLVHIWENSSRRFWIPVATRRCFNVDTTSCDIVRRHIDFETTSCVSREVWTSEAYSEPSRRYKMELLAKMVKCWKLHLIC